MTDSVELTPTNARIRIVSVIERAEITGAYPVAYAVVNRKFVHPAFFIKYNTQEEVESTFAEFRKRNIPIDNIVIDWLHWKQDSWGSHEFDKERLPHQLILSCSLGSVGLYTRRPQYATAPLGSHSIFIGTRTPASSSVENLKLLGFHAVRQRSGTISSLLIYIFCAEVGYGLLAEPREV